MCLTWTAQYDKFFMRQHLGGYPRSVDEIEFAQQYANKTVTTLQSLHARGHVTVFCVSCYHHAGMYLGFYKRCGP